MKVALSNEGMIHMLIDKLALLLPLLTVGLLQPAPAPAADGWRALFDGKQLGRWEVVKGFDFIHHGKVEVKDGTLVLGRGGPGTAVRFTGKFPKIDYEISLEAMRVEGEDFFCGMTFPVGDAALTLIVGGWRGPVVGLSCIDDEPAVENETCLFKDFKKKRWYHIRLRVARERIQAWIGKEKVVDLETEDRKFSIWFEPETALPLAIATWDTTGALRNIRVRRIGEGTAENKGKIQTESPVQPPKPPVPSPRKADNPPHHTTVR